MKWIRISWKNVIVNMSKTLVLSGFIFSAVLLIVICSNFILSVKDNLQLTVRQALCGEIQIRPANLKKNDMFNLNGSWDDMEYLDTEEVEQVSKIIDYKLNLKHTRCIRYNVGFKHEEEEMGAMTIGLEEDARNYQATLVLKEGRYIEKSGEVVISQKQARKLNVSIGDQIVANSINQNDDLVVKCFEVVGVGDIDILSNFSFDVIYMNIEDARILSGLEKGTATDILIYCGKEDVSKNTQELARIIREQGSLDNIKTTTWKDMGGFINAIFYILLGQMYLMLGIFIVIIAILINNIISIIIIERRNEIGTLRAIGFSQNQVAKIFISEFMIICLNSATVGAIVAQAIIWRLSKHTIHTIPPLNYILGNEFLIRGNVLIGISVVAIISIFICILVSIPCCKAAKERPVDILR